MMNQLRRLTRPSNSAPVRSDVPSLTHPISQACTQAQMREPAYAHWCSRIGEMPRAHRKQWEFCFILQALARNGMIAPGLKGLGFGVGGEPLSALLAAQGVAILATDLPESEAQAKGWVETEQHASDRMALNDRGLCPADIFDHMVEFRSMDMNAIPDDVAGFDFCWSACALEHLGSIQLGLAFIERSIDCLKPGGIAVHTTEFNCSSNTHTLDDASTVLFRKRDFLWLARRLRASGHHIELNFEIGTESLDIHVDMPPYSDDQHLKLQIEEWVTTSFGLIIRRSIRS
jgi:2-polyprenyl-3-methyl-5-hydroxy-6-metoxy-1,4-benzoquinol methylase